MSASPAKAVFLSYASQDAEAARRICETLRASGVEVWFDADGGLEHGDEWDAKIRRQIKECVLFIAIISKNTQARHEGYFRLEWDLAAERARSIASGVPFILPVVIDDTREPDALVPDRFRAVQWTKLRGGEVPAEVQQRFLKLWSHRTGVLKHEGQVGARTSTSASINPAGEPPALPAKRRWLVPAVVAAAAIATIAHWTYSPSAASNSKPTASAAPAPSEADQLVRQARELIYDPDSARNEFALAENLLKRATDLSPTSGAAWGASALLNHYFYSRTYDHNRQRLVRSQAEAEKALRLEPRATDALLALGLHRQALGENDRARDYLERAHASDPQNPKVILAQSLQLSDHPARAKFLLEAADRIPRPAELFYYASIELRWARRLEPARVACERAIAAQPFWRTFVARADVEYLQSADPAKIDAWLDRVPEIKRDEPRVAFTRYLAAMLRHDAANAIRVLKALAVDFLEDSYFIGPKAYLLAQAHELAGQPQQAAEQWQLAERTVRDKLSAEPGELGWRAMLAVILAGEQRATESKTAADACAADERLKHAKLYAIETTAQAYVILGEPSRAIALLRAVWPDKFDGNISAATLAADPRWAPLRGQPGYAELVNEVKRAEAIVSDDAPGARATPDLSAAALAKADPKSVAVLAFANQSDDKTNEYFSDGIADELLTVLQKIPGLRVAARTSAWSFKGKNPTAQEVGEKLGMAHVVEGSVQKFGNRVKITARLSRAATNEELWSHSFGPLELTDVFATQSEIAQKIVGELRGRLTGEGASAAATKAEIQAQVQAALKGGTKNPEAHNLYLQGRFFATRATSADVVHGVDYYEQALKLDPAFATAWAALARARAWQGTWEPAHAERFEQARTAATRALAIDPDLADAHATISQAMQRHYFDWRTMRTEIARAVALAPSDAAILTDACSSTYMVGEWDKAFDFGRRAVTLDPVNPDARLILGIAYHHAGRILEAREEVRRAIEISPNGTFAHLLACMVELEAGAPEAALALAKKEPERMHLLEGLALAEYACGHRVEAVAALKALETEFTESAPYKLAQVYAVRGQRDQAFSWLERAWQQRDPGITWTKVAVLLRSLHADPRWPVFLKKIGLHDEQLK